MRATLVAAIIATCQLALPAPAAAATFGGFDINLVGSATVLPNGDLQLTTATNDLVGAGWLTSALSTANSFSVTYSFSLLGPGTATQADGIALAFQNTGTSALGIFGGSLGYQGIPGVAGSVVQTWINNNVGLDTVGDPYLAKDAPTDLGNSTSITGAQTVSYNAGTHMLSMAGVLNVDGTLFNVNDTAPVNLQDRFGPSMFMGFTGGTGGAISDQRITSMVVSVSPVPEPEIWAMMLVGISLVTCVTKRRRRAA